MENCSTCRFYRVGQCHAHPPVAAGVIPHQGVGGVEPRIVWAIPDPPPTFWCGEYKVDIVLAS